MYQTIYEYSEVHAYRYTFISTGKRNIDKVIEFIPTAKNNVYNLAFGDLLPNGGIDDMANSNNGDIIKIFATIINVLQKFTMKNPSFIIYITGSTRQRTLLYNRILKTYYQLFREKFAIAGLIKTDNGEIYVPFDPKSTSAYFAFLIQRI
jgi:hypothetical protein